MEVPYLSTLFGCQLHARGVHECLRSRKRILIAENKILELNKRKSRFRRISKYKLVFDVIGRSYVSAKNVEEQFATLITAFQSDKETLESLLSIQYQTFSFGIFRYVELGQAIAVFRSKIIYKLSTPNLTSCFPNKKRANRILTQYGIKKSAGLFFIPYKCALNIW